MRQPLSRALTCHLLLSLACACPAAVIPNVDVFDGFHMLRNQSVTIENGMIVGIKTVAGPPSGYTLLPGLIDAHCHVSSEESLEQAAALGVTTELDMWGDPATLIPLKKAVDEGRYPNAAEFRTAGTGANAVGGHPSEMGGPKFPMLHPGDDIQKFVDARFREGSDYLKIMFEHQLPTLSEDQLRQLVLAAHRRGRLAVSHEGVQSEGLAEMNAGVDGVEHIFADSPISPFFLAAAKATRMVFTPTLTVISAACGRSTGPGLAADGRIKPYLLPWQNQILVARFPPKEIARNHWEYARGAVHALHEAGLPILAGTDAPNPGTAYGASVHEEMRLLIECGLTAEEALRAATSEPAAQFGLIDRGRIEIGRRADLLLIDGDPTKDIRATRNIVRVWKAGREIDRAAIARKMALPGR